MNQELLNLYKQLILDHSKNPHNYNLNLEHNYDNEIFNPLCGDKIVVFCFIKNKTTKIQNLYFNGKGCAICIASASLMTEYFKNQNLDFINKNINLFLDMLQNQESNNSKDYKDLGNKILTLRGVKNFPSRIRCASLAWLAMQQIISKI